MRVAQAVLSEDKPPDSSALSHCSYHKNCMDAWLLIVLGHRAACAHSAASHEHTKVGIVYCWRWSLSATLKIPMVPLERNLYYHPSARLLWERQFEEVLLGLWWETIPNWECDFVHRKQGNCSYRKTCMISRWLERSRTWLACGRNRWRMLILMNQFHYLTSYIWDALNVNASRTNHYWWMQKHVRVTNFCWSNCRIPGREKPPGKTVAWSNGIEGHAENCVERYCELANIKTEQLYNVSCPCLDDHHCKKEEPESVGELSTACSQNCSKMLVFGSYW